MLFYYLDTSFKLWSLTIAKNLIPQTKDVIIFLLKQNQERTSNITFTGWKENPANIRLDEDVFRLRLQKTSLRRLQGVLMKTNIFLLIIRLQNTSSRRLQDVLVNTNIFVLSIHLQDVFKTFSRQLQDVFKTSCYNVFKTSSKHLQDVSQIRLEDIFKMF